MLAVETSGLTGYNAIALVHSPIANPNLEVSGDASRWHSRAPSAALVQYNTVTLANCYLENCI